MSSRSFGRQKIGGETITQAGPRRAAQKGGPVNWTPANTVDTGRGRAPAREGLSLASGDRSRNAVAEMNALPVSAN